jgi:hypothetical protein
MVLRLQMVTLNVGQRKALIGLQQPLMHVLIGKHLKGFKP